jgi:hypothetical protein
LVLYNPALPGRMGGLVTFVSFLPDLLSDVQVWIALVATWLGQWPHAAGAAFGGILLVIMAAAVAVALWQAVYRTVLVWLRTR